MSDKPLKTVTLNIDRYTTLFLIELLGEIVDNMEDMGDHYTDDIKDISNVITQLTDQKE